MDEIDNIRTIVKEEIHKKHGHEVTYAKDCQILSESILEITKRQVSVSTLKRFFGIIKSPFKPSKYTLDTLAVYLDYKNWDKLLNTFENKQTGSSEQDYWDKLKIRVEIVTKQSLRSIKAKIGDQITDFPVRKVAITQFEKFLNSPQTATAIIAPGGYGKTTITTQLTELFFTDENAKYPNDIVCFVDGSILANLLNLNLEIFRVQNIINFQLQKSFSVYFRKNPDQVKGRFVLIIESLYEIFHQEEKLTNFVENLMDIVSSYEGISWFKLLVTCRPDNWKIFMNLIKNNPKLKSQWFDVSFEGPVADSINVLHLNENEIENYLKKKHFPINLENLKFHYPEITELINIPNLLHLFCLSQKPEDIHSDLELLNQFSYKKVFAEPYLEEKSRIINSFFHLSNYLKQDSAVKKEELLTSAIYNHAYKELITNNILYEYTIPGSYLSVHTYVKFSNNTLLDFFLANKWIEENKFDLDLVRKVFKFYEDNPLLQANILKYLIKFAFKENNRNVLKDIFSVFEGDKNLFSSPDNHDVNPEIIYTIGVELRKNKELRDFLIPRYARSKLGQLIYFESFFDMDSLVLHSGDTIDHYLENKHTADAMIYGHFLKFMQYLLAGDNVSCQKEHELLKSLKLSDEISPLLAGYYYGAQIIFQSVYTGKLNSNLIEKIYKKSELFFENEVQPATSVPIYEFFLIYSFNYGDNFKEILQLINWTLSRYVLSDFYSSWQYQLFLSIYARALLNTGEVQKALEVFNRVEMKAIPINYKYYVQLRYYIIQVEFLIFEKQYKKAIKVIEEIKTISQMIRHKLFYDKAMEFESKMMPE